MARYGPRLRRCRKCGSTNLYELDGSKCDGLPGIMYRACNGCGDAQAIKKPQRREKLDNTPKPQSNKEKNRQ